MRWGKNVRAERLLLSVHEESPEVVQVSERGSSDSGGYQSTSKSDKTPLRT